ncbi:MAG TPA: YihY/virulence factor BrkB family protein, partial [Ilumatobacteraceae bacterium]|nr:YihY/virulence factor BrkB family protein [Ilumatobacteraceae bacterium]
NSLAQSVEHPLSGNPFALVVGIGGALWAGMGAMQAAQDAMNRVWDVRHGQMPNFFVKRLRSLALLGSIGLLLIATAVTPQVIGAITSGAIADVLLQLASVAMSVGLFAIAMRVLTEADVSWKEVLPGACIAGVAYTVLQIVGRVYITNTVSRAEDTYGTFAIVIGLLSWMFLIGQVFVIAAEVNVVRARRLWPRGLQTDSLTPNA